MSLFVFTFAVLLKHQQKNTIMKAIMEKAGLESKAQAMVFSLPGSHAIGLKMPE